MSSLTPRLDRQQKNYIINGDMRIAQRNTSFTSIADSIYNLDRYVYFKTGAMVHNLTQDTDVPTVAQSNYLFQNSLRLNLTTPDTSIAAGDRVEISQIVEGYNFAHLAQKDFTLSFWVKATLPGTYCVYFRNSGADRSYIAEYTINATNTWEKKTLHISASVIAGTWNYASGIGLRIGWTLAAGTTFQTTAGAWQTGNFLATANQVNGVNTGATDFKLTGIMLSEGTLTDPEFVTFGKDLEAEVAACQRYYEKSYSLTVPPATVTQDGMWSHAYGGAAQTIRVTSPFKTRKRTASTSVIVYNPQTGASQNVAKDVSANVAIAFSLGNETHWGYEVGLPAGDPRVYAHFTAESEL